MRSANDIEANWGLVGHGWAVEFLRRSLLHGRNRHAYLITGAAGLGKGALAHAFALALNCEATPLESRPCRRCRACRALMRGQDPDLILAQADEGASIKIEQVRELTRLLSLQPYASRFRIAILDDFDLAPPLTQDALLKTLEEPAPFAVLVLLASAPERVLPTIRSRAQTIPLRPAPIAAIRDALVKRGCEAGKAELIARLSAGRAGWALNAWRDETALDFRGEMLDLLRDVVAGSHLARLKAADKLSRRAGRDKAMLRAAAEIWLTYWRDVLLQCHESPVKPGNSDRVDEIRALARGMDGVEARAAIGATRRTLEAFSTNANTRLALEALFLEWARPAQG